MGSLGFLSEEQLFPHPAHLMPAEEQILRMSQEPQGIANRLLPLLQVADNKFDVLFCHAENPISVTDSIRKVTSSTALKLFFVPLTVFCIFYPTPPTTDPDMSMLVVTDFTPCIGAS